MPTPITIDANVNLDFRSATAKASAFQKQFAAGFTRAGGLKGITTDVNNFDAALGKATSRIVSLGAASVVFNTLRKSFGAFADATIEVEQALAKINVNLGQSADGLKQFSGQIFNVARQTGSTFEDAAKGAEELARQGLGAEETLKRLSAALILNRTTGIGVEESINSVTSALNTFNKEALTASDVVNRLAAVDTKFAVSSKDLAEAVQRVGSSAAEAGVDFNQLLAIVTSVQQTTQRGGATIGNALKTIFTRVGNPEVLNDLQAIGVAVKDVEGNTLPAIRILQNLATVYDTLGASQKNVVSRQVAGTYQINILKAALSDLNKEQSVYNGALKTAANAGDAAIKKNEELNKTLQSLITNTGTSVKQLFASIGNQNIAPFTKELLGAFEKVRAVLSGDTGSDIGKSIGDGILKGITNVITGPGILGLTVVLAKGFGKVISTIGAEAKGLLGLNDAASKRAEIQGRINALQKAATSEEIATLQAARGVLAQKEAILAISARIRQTELIGTPLQNAFLGSGPLGGAKITGPQKVGSFARGHIGNFADPLFEAIKREKAAGVPEHLIYVDKDKRVASSDNPHGLLVANKRDEPAGGFQGVDRAISEGRDPKKVGTRPNFAVSEAAQRNLGLGGYIRPDPAIIAKRLDISGINTDVSAKRIKEQVKKILTDALDLSKSDIKGPVKTQFNKLIKDVLYVRNSDIEIMQDTHRTRPDVPTSAQTEAAINAPQKAKEEARQAQLLAKQTEAQGKAAAKQAAAQEKLAAKQVALQETQARKLAAIQAKQFADQQKEDAKAAAKQAQFRDRQFKAIVAQQEKDAQKAKSIPYVGTNQVRQALAGGKTGDSLPPPNEGASTAAQSTTFKDINAQNRYFNRPSNATKASSARLPDPNARDGRFTRDAFRRARVEDYRDSGQRQKDIVAQNERLSNLRPQLQAAAADKQQKNANAVENAAAEKKANRSRFANNASLAAAFVLPAASGFIADGAGGTAEGKGRGALKGALTGAGTGAILGPVGAGIGAAAGGLIGYLSKLSKSVEEFNAEIDKGTAAQTQNVEAIARFSALGSQISEADNASPDARGRLAGQRADALSKVDPEFRTALAKQGITADETNKILAQAQDKLARIANTADATKKLNAINKADSGFGANIASKIPAGSLLDELINPRADRVFSDVKNADSLTPNLLEALKDKGSLGKGDRTFVNRSLANGEAGAGDVEKVNKILESLGQTAGATKDNFLDLIQALSKANTATIGFGKDRAEQKRQVEEAANRLTGDAFLNKPNLDSFGGAAAAGRNPNASRGDRAQSRFDFFNELKSNNGVTQGELDSNATFKQAKAGAQADNIGNSLIAFLKANNPNVGNLRDSRGDPQLGAIQRTLEIVAKGGGVNADLAKFLTTLVPKVQNTQKDVGIADRRIPVNFSAGDSGTIYGGGTNTGQGGNGVTSYSGGKTKGLTLAQLKALNSGNASGRVYQTPQDIANQVKGRNAVPQDGKMLTQQPTAEAAAIIKAAQETTVSAAKVAETVANSTLTIAVDVKGMFDEAGNAKFAEILQGVFQQMADIRSQAARDRGSPNPPAPPSSIGPKSPGLYATPASNPGLAGAIASR